MEHNFTGKWISCKELADLEPRGVFHRYLDSLKLSCDEHRNRHVLFRAELSLRDVGRDTKIYISADDYYKLYINGAFVASGPAPSYHTNYGYNVINVNEYLQKGTNTIAIHTLYQGLVNRVWQSADNRHGLIFDLVSDGEVLLSSSESIKVCLHSGYEESGICGYDTQFLETYDSASAEADFMLPEYDDSAWECALEVKNDDHVLKKQESHMLEFEKILPASKEHKTGSITYDFGSNYVGYLVVKARGKRGDKVTVRCAQEKNDDGSIRYALRANCTYEESWLLREGDSLLDWFDYKSFRYAELVLPEGVEVLDAYLIARHYPFELKAALLPKYSEDPKLQRIWELCINTQKYGVQEVIQDCMEREKGFYLGDGCYTALTNMILTGDDSMARKLIDDAFATSFISDTLVTCMDCSFMQEIAEYPLMLIYFVLWHYRVVGDTDYLRSLYPKITKLLDAYKASYEKDGVLRDIDKFCVVEWPANFRHGYDVDLTERVVCHQAHVAMNAYYIEAVKTANEIARILGLAPYRNTEALVRAFNETFYDGELGLFKDGESTQHVSLVGNSFIYAFGLYPDDGCKEKILKLYSENGISSLSLFCTFIMLMGFVRDGRRDLIKEALLDEGAWLRMLREDATTTFEGWGKDTKWNTSLFHLTMSYAALFMADTDIEKILM